MFDIFVHPGAVLDARQHPRSTRLRYLNGTDARDLPSILTPTRSAPRWAGFFLSAAQLVWC